MPFQIDIPQDWIIEAEAWEWATVLGIAGAIAIGLYGWNARIRKRSTGQGLPPWGRWGMGILRFSAVGILGFLLLEPLIRSVQYDEEKPVAIVLMDESESVLVRADSSEAGALKDWSDAVYETLNSEDLVVERYGFGSALRPLESSSDSTYAWTGAQTNIDEAIRSLSPRLENRNIAGVLLASDGLVNRGASPIFGVQWPNFPVHTVGLGDTTAVRDRWIHRVNHNTVAYLGNAFPLQTFVESQGLADQSGRIEIVHNGTTIASESWTSDGEFERTKFDFMLPADAIGLQRYTVRIAALDGEYDKTNNSRTVYIEVLESRRIVACVSAAAHPDIGALRMALEAMESYELRLFDLSTLKNPNALTDALNEADVVIAHNLLGKRWGGMEWTKLLAMNNLPVWWWAADEAAWGHLQSNNDLGVQLTQSGDLNQTHRARLNPGFSLLEWPEGVSDALRSWPPFFGPFEQATWSPAWSQLLFRQFGDVQTQDAFWGLRGSATGTKQILTIGEGLWRWRMRNYALEQNHDSFDALVQRQVQFLAAEDARQRLTVQTEKRIGADQRLEFTAQAYDAAWNPFRDATIELTLTDESGQAYTQTMLPSASGYAADFGRMPAGTYRWEALSELDGTAFDASGLVIVNDTQIERAQLAADHTTLQRISEATGGNHLGDWRGADAAAVRDAFLQSGLPAVVRHEQTNLREAIDWPFWLLLAMALLALEWIIRRRNLGY